ncbi:MAG: anhydro-N-acetylmuramic acid kinase [Trueperaceae bacterium]
MNVLSVMSGTSMDGADAVLAAIDGGGDRPFTWSVVDRGTAPYPAKLRARLGRAITPGGADAVELTLLHAELGDHVAELAAVLVERARLAGRPVDLVVISGQTIWHEPRADASRGVRIPATLQLGEPALVVTRTGLSVVSDLRQADLAEGGQGAPLVPFGDLALYGQAGVARAVHNLGGIGNLTWLPPDLDPGRVAAFDTGPANCLLDELAWSKARLDRDDEGGLAAAGRVDAAVLARLMDHPYLRLPPPKTTGREAFNLRELADSGLASLSLEDALATATAFTVASTAQAYEEHLLQRGGRRLDEVWLAGGGARNATLVAGLREALEALGAQVATFEERGMDSADREALAFAVMGYEAWHGRVNTLPSATGARRAAVAGRISRPPPTPAPGS